MSAPKDGGPAFPIQSHVLPNGEVRSEHPGMALRDWFAGKALQGFASNPDPQCCQATAAKMCDWAYDWADTMMERREKQKSP